MLHRRLIDTGKSRHSWRGCATAWGFGNGFINPSGARAFSSPDKAG